MTITVCAPAARGQGGEQPDRPGAEDQHAAAGEVPGPAHRVDGSGQRFDEHGLDIGEPIGHPVQPIGWRR
ncbi:hypothetical protein ACPEIC_29600 [Stenotrophomonas sp. NPDC087984]